MTDILVFEDSLDRIAAELAMFEGVRPVRWHADGRMTVGGRDVAPDEVAPQIGWISFDIFMRQQMTAYINALVSFDSMRWVQSANAGLDNPLYASLARRGVRISKSWAQSIPIAEYVLAHALHHLQGIEARPQAQRAAAWKYFQFRELYASRWLIIGFGHIGRRVAQRAKGFECHITTLRGSNSPDPAADEVITREQLPTALQDADVVVLACPQTLATTGMVDASFVESMKEGSVLINIARGGLINDEALLAGLARNRPEAVVLDVFNEEPLPPTDPYWSHPQVTVTAHISNAGEGTVARGSVQFLENLARFLKGEPVTDEVDNTTIAVP